MKHCIDNPIIMNSLLKLYDGHTYVQFDSDNMSHVNLSQDMSHTHTCFPTVNPIQPNPIQTNSYL